MHKLFLLLCFISPAAFAQNVGVGTSTPVAKLNIVGSSSNAAIPGLTSAAVFRIGINAAEGIDFGKMGTAPYSAWMQAGINGTVSDPISLQPAGGNVGIGIISPTAKLHINGNMKLEGLNLFEFGAGVAGKEVNAGKVGYNAFGQNALTFVGAGTNTSNRAVYFFAEGGTTMTGPLDIGGPLRINGNSGSAGQVLTSNGTGNPSWSNTSFTSTERFAVHIQEGVSVFDDAVIYLTKYNLNPANVVIGSTTITINRSGLYHFDIGANGSLTFAAATSFRPTFDLTLYTGPGSGIRLISDKRMDSPTYSLSGSYSIEGNVSIDVYIAAPANVRLSYGLNTLGIPGGSTSHNLEGFIAGYLISE